MTTVRIIPRLDIKGPNLVKGINLEGLRVLGKSDQFARYYYETGADELLYMDAVASLYGRGSLLEIVEWASRSIFIPLTVGGGIRTIDDIRAVLRAGADKVALNTAAIRNPDFLALACRTFGSSTIAVAIDAVRHGGGFYECLTDYGREATGVDALTWAKQAARLGAGELIVTAIQREGMGQGFDLDLSAAIAGGVDVPVVAGGGAGQLAHVYEAFTSADLSGVALASMLHYEAVQHFQTDASAFSGEGNIEYLRRGSAPPVTPQTIGAVKSYLSERGVSVRPVEVPIA